MRNNAGNHFYPKRKEKFLSLAEIVEWTLKIGTFVINLMRLYLDLFSRKHKKH